MNDLKRERLKLLKNLTIINDKIRHYQNNCPHLKVEKQREFDGHRNLIYYQCIDCEATMNQIVFGQLIL